ncbi:MAG: hypothetical protein WBF21_05485 [Steroidobacteraceae bacterium]
MTQSLADSPVLFPHGLDVRTDSVHFIRLERADYERASFLDARILTPHTSVRTLPWAEVAAAVDAAKLAERCAFIFHIGHVGSTLLSRLIGTRPDAMSLREPMVLRVLAQLQSESGPRPPAWTGAGYDVRLGACLKLLSRTFEPRQRAVIKATSFVSELAAELLSRGSAPRALAMCVSPESYLATILGGPNSRQEAKMLLASRLQRLHRRIGRQVWRPEALSEGETLALGWACEASALAQAKRTAGERMLLMDFDRFLARPPALLLAALHHLGIDATPAEVAAILNGPHMQRYSKAPEHAYDAALRREVLNEARAVHGAEISRGLAWLERAAMEFVPVAEAVRLAGAQ